MAEGVKQFKDITLTYECTGVIGILYILTDQPGGTYQIRKTISLPITTARTTTTFPLDDAGELDGKLVGYKVVNGSTSGTIKLYSGKIRFRVYGLYLDGSRGDIWETQPMTLGGE